MLACDAWTVGWVTDLLVVSSAKPVRVVEYDHDGEFRHLGYTAPLTAHSRTAEKALTALIRRAAKVFATMSNLPDCGVSIVPSVLVPKTVYHFAFGKATVAAVEETERDYGDIIRQSLGVAMGVSVEHARGLAGVRWPGCSSARHGGDESTVTPIPIHDHQLSTFRL